VILVSVREDNSPDFTASVAQVREIREDEIDTEVLVARKRETGVDDKACALVFEDGHVLADLAEPTERDDS
jgi:hypothetical protein